MERKALALSARRPWVLGGAPALGSAGIPALAQPRGWAHPRWGILRCCQNAAEANFKEGTQTGTAAASPAQHSRQRSRAGPLAPGKFILTQQKGFGAF